MDKPHRVGEDMCKIFNVFIFMLFFVGASLFAAEADVVEEKTWQDEFLGTWNSENWEFVVPVNTWHNRWVYDHKKAHTFNERPWGFGVGKYRYDASGNRHSLVGLTFQDSHDSPEPTFAYGWQKIWRQGETIRPSLGLMGGVTFRKDYDWMPLPAILPVIGVDIGPFSFENTYVPGLGGNNGHVLFTWITWRF